MMLHTYLSVCVGIAAPTQQTKARHVRFGSYFVCLIRVSSVTFEEVVLVPFTNMSSASVCFASCAVLSCACLRAELCFFCPFHVVSHAHTLL